MPAYSTIDRRDLDRIAARFDLGPVVAVTEAGGWENTSFRVRTEEGRFQFKIYENRAREDLDLLTRIDRRLARHRFPTPAPLAAVDGETVGEVDGRLVKVYRWLRGEEPVPSAAVAAEIGSALAALHRVPPPAALPALRWGPPPERALSRQARRRGLSGHRFLRWLAARRGLYRLPARAKLPRGLAHADLVPDNTLFAGQALVAVLDFDECCRDALLIDLAMAIVGFCWDRRNRRQDRWIAALLDGYGELRALERRERALLDRYVAFAALLVATWRFRQFDLRHPQLGLAGRYRQMATRVEQCQARPIAL